MQEIRTADVDLVASRVVRAVASGRTASPAETRFLLREYVAAGRDEVRDALGLALAHALAVAEGEAATARRAAWLVVFVEAAEIADDDRVAAAARDLVRRLRAEWPIDLARAGVAAAAASVEACLRATTLAGSADIVRPAIDELERIVGATYRPGEGLRVQSEGANSLRADGASAGRASGTDHATVASALLTAFEVTGRLPYSMLAEELMSGFRAESASARPADLSEDCDAALVLCRLAALHDNAEYRAAAVLMPGADYRADAARILQDRAPHAIGAQLADAAHYGIALRELISLR